MKINLGGNAVGDFSAEEEFLQLGEEAVKTRYHGEIKGSGADLKVFKTQRFAREEDLVINLPVPDGIYAVTLMFAETWEGAFEAGKRVFDVYLGSKPGGVIKVEENFEPFRVGGPARPVRKKYTGVATYDGLTVALRPIKQNAQIAGMVISGFSYSEPLMHELPTVEGDISEVEDFSVLSNVGPSLPGDLSLVYDPSMNRKLKSENDVPTGGPGIDTSPHQTSIHTPDNLLTSQGRATGPGASVLPSAVYSNVQKSSLSPNLQLGYNSFSRPPVSHFHGSPENSPSLDLRAGIVREEVENVASSLLPSDLTQKTVPSHDPRFLNPPPSAQGGYLRHGRRLASIPVEMEERHPITQRDSPQSSVRDQSMFPSSTLDHPSSSYLPGTQEQGPSAPNYSDYSTRVKSAEEPDNQAFGGGQTTGYVAPLDVGKRWDSAQNELKTPKTTADQQSQNRGEIVQAVYQAQAEASTYSSPLSQTRDSPESSSLDSISQSSIPTKPMEDPMKPVFYESTSRARGQESVSQSSGIQEPAGQVFPSHTDEGSLMLPSSGLHRQQSQEQLHTQTENLVRSAMMSSAHTDVVNSQINGMGRGSGATDFDSFGSSSDFDYQKRMGHRRSFDASESFRSSEIDQPRNSGVRDPLHPRSHEGPQTIVPHPVGMNEERIDNLASSPRKISIQRQKATGNDVSGFVDKVNAGSTEPTWQSAKAYLGRGDVSRNALGDRPIEAEGKEDYKTIFSRSYRPISSEHLSETVVSSNLRSTDPGAVSMVSHNVPPPGVHNGNWKLDGLCIDNSTHCSCGMVEQIADSPEECLFVVDENVSPMVCSTRPCNGKVVCACAPGASTLCQRSVVKTILVRALATFPDGMENPELVSCTRQTLEHGIMVLTPVM